MYSLEFPFGRKLYVCGICGIATENRGAAEQCDADTPTETTNLNVGDTVELPEYRLNLDKKQRAWVEVFVESFVWTVAELFYAQPGVRLSSVDDGASMWDWVRRHTLCIRLERRLHNDLSGFTGANERFTYQHFREIQEGIRKIVRR